MKTTFTIIKRVYGKEMNQVNTKTYATKEDATNAGNSWLRDCTIPKNIREGWNFEVIENTDNGFNFTGICKSN